MKPISNLNRRFWEIEPFLKKAILYGFATIVIYVAYILLISVTNLFLFEETRAVQFIVMVLSMSLFLFLRDKFQRILDRLFYRENYNPSEVITGFEEFVTRIYNPAELKSRITIYLDRVFHFKSFIYLVKSDSKTYKAEIIYGAEIEKAELRFSEEAETKLFQSRILTFGKLKGMYMLNKLLQWDLVIPTIVMNRQKGMMIIGRKRSEKRYTYQEVQLLIVLARRSSALIHTAELYQKELDRILLLERERTRIAKDFHDDVGASLTRISFLAQMLISGGAGPKKMQQWLMAIRDTCQEATFGITSIIWALNDKNDTTQGLIAHIRRFVMEYLQETPVKCTFEIPEDLPESIIRAEIKRNVYLCVREALNNLVKYSDSRSACISIDLTENMLRLKIRDNGKGFNIDKVKAESNGLENMKKRMDYLGGHFQVETAKGNGTELAFSIPV